MIRCQYTSYTQMRPDACGSPSFSDITSCIYLEVTLSVRDLDLNRSLRSKGSSILKILIS